MGDGLSNGLGLHYGSAAYPVLDVPSSAGGGQTEQAAGLRCWMEFAMKWLGTAYFTAAGFCLGFTLDCWLHDDDLMLAAKVNTKLTACESTLPRDQRCVISAVKEGDDSE